MVKDPNRAGEAEISGKDEIELKLAVSPEDAVRLQRSSYLRTISTQRARRIALSNTYFDTPERDLSRNKMSLRIRKVGNRKIQTLKAPSGKSAGLQHLIEFEAEVQGDEPNLEKVDDKKLRKFLGKLMKSRGLGHSFSTEFTRSSRIVEFARSKIEVCVDVGKITAGEKEMPISEVELELIEGQADKLPKLALELNKKYAVRTESRSKANRAYDLLENRLAKPLKAEKISLTPEQSLEDAFQFVVRSCLTQIRGNECAVQDGSDSEGVHQMRIGLRRLLTALRAFRPVLKRKRFDYLKSTAAWAQNELGAARDWDVFREHTVPQLIAAGRDQRIVTWLDKQSVGMQRDSYDRARALLVDSRYNAFVLQLTEWLNTGGFISNKARRGQRKGHLAKLAGEMLEAHDKKLRGLASRLDSLSTEELHRLRLKAKQMRYQAEFFQGLYSKSDARRLVKSITGIQDVLGSLNDAVVAENLMNDVKSVLTRPGDLRQLTAAQTMLNQHMSDCIAKDRKRIRKVVKGYIKLEKIWV